jgi:hypothetical protein
MVLEGARGGREGRVRHPRLRILGNKNLLKVYHNRAKTGKSNLHKYIILKERYLLSAREAHTEKTLDNKKDIHHGCHISGN